MSQVMTVLVSLLSLSAGAEGAQSVLGSCRSSVPPKVHTAIEQAVEYRKSCSFFKGKDNTKIVINDYSEDGIPTMYIFDSTGKSCEQSTTITYGSGPGKKDRATPVPCSEDKEHLTPPGFHITARHNGAKYNDNNSLLLVGLEDQGSAGRGILIHPTAATMGSGVTWGCTGVSENCAQQVRDILGEGSLVYNYFGEAPLAPECKAKNNTKGYGDKHNGASCRKDPSSGNSSPGGGENSGAPATS